MFITPLFIHCPAIFIPFTSDTTFSLQKWQEIFIVVNINSLNIMIDCQAFEPMIHVKFHCIGILSVYISYYLTAF